METRKKGQTFEQNLPSRGSTRGGDVQGFVVMRGRNGSLSNRQVSVFKWPRFRCQVGNVGKKRSGRTNKHEKVGYISNEKKQSAGAEFYYKFYMESYTL